MNSFHGRQNFLSLQTRRWGPRASKIDLWPLVFSLGKPTFNLNSCPAGTESDYSHRAKSKMSQKLIMDNCKNRQWTSLNWILPQWEYFA